jgi:hypothetical protein
MQGIVSDIFTFTENNFGKCFLILYVCPNKYTTLPSPLGRHKFVNITYRSEKMGGVSLIALTSIDSRNVWKEQKYAILRYLQWCSWGFPSSGVWRFVNKQSDPDVSSHRCVLTFKSQWLIDESQDLISRVEISWQNSRTFRTLTNRTLRCPQNIGNQLVIELLLDLWTLKVRKLRRFERSKVRIRLPTDAVPYPERRNYHQ